jgi:hypothetical protein
VPPAPPPAITKARPTIVVMGVFPAIAFLDLVKLFIPEVISL